MKFGKVDNPDHMDFSFPGRKSGDVKALELLNNQGEKKLHFGLPIWAGKEFVGEIYPPEATPKDYLHYYSKSFNSIELNSSHYHVPTETQVARWREMVHEEFKFCPKFPQNISHSKYFYEEYDKIREFLNCLELFKNNLGVSFIQFPTSFSPHYFRELEVFVKRLPQSFSYAIELRHSDWFSNPSVWERLTGLLEWAKISLVITDTLGVRKILHQKVTNNKVFIRFNGQDLHSSDFKRLDAWSDILLFWESKGVSEVFFMLHQQNEVKGVELALYLGERLKEGHSHFKIELPKKYQEAQFSLF